MPLLTFYRASAIRPCFLCFVFFPKVCSSSLRLIGLLGAQSTSRFDGRRMLFAKDCATWFKTQKILLSPQLSTGAARHAIHVRCVQTVSEQKLTLWIKKNERFLTVGIKKLNMKINPKLILIFTILAIVSLKSQAQNKDSLIIDRDKIGDINAPYVKAGEGTGAILLPGTDISIAIGGFIKATALYDTYYNVKNEIILPGTFTDEQIGDGQTYSGARSSRLFLRGFSSVDNLKIDGYFEVDFRGSSEITLRHAYLELQNNKGTKLLMGQYWSLAMDLQTIPEGLVEPTVSGGIFARKGQIRYTRKLNKKLTIAVSLEDPTSSDIKGENITPINKLPDGITSLSIDPSPKWHFSFTGLYRPLLLSNNLNNQKEYDFGFLGSSGVIFKPSDINKFTLVALYGEGISAYVLGADGTAAYFSQEKLKKQEQFGGYVAYGHVWNKKFRSNIAYGKFNGSELRAMPQSNIKSSTYAFVNTFYHLNKYVNIGIEWIYTSKELHSGSTLNNNRFQFGIQIF